MTTYHYDDVGDLDYFTYPNGLKHAYTYTEKRLKALTLTTNRISSPTWRIAGAFAVACVTVLAQVLALYYCPANLVVLSVLVLPWFTIAIVCALVVPMKSIVPGKRMLLALLLSAIPFVSGYVVLRVLAGSLMG